MKTKTLTTLLITSTLLGCAGSPPPENPPTISYRGHLFFPVDVNNDQQVDFLVGANNGTAGRCLWYAPELKDSPAAPCRVGNYSRPMSPELRTATSDAYATLEKLNRVLDEEAH